MSSNIKFSNSPICNRKQYFLKVVVLLFIIFFCFDNVKCQIINSLEMRIKHFESEIIKANDSIKSLKSLISIEQRKIAPIIENKELRIKTFVNQSWHSKFLPEYDSQNVNYLEKGSEITVIGYFKGALDYYFVKLADGHFFWDANIIMTDSLIGIKKMLEASYKAKKVKEDSIYKAKITRDDSIYQREVKKETKERKVYLINRYGAKIAEKILNRQIWLGMSDKMLIETIGKPVDINRTVGSFGIHEQWVYGSIQNTEYYYFENGKLKSWQD